jgi:hypothetical protein
MLESHYQVSAIANREVRRVPRGWRHPRDARGRYLPLHRADFFFGMSETERDEIDESYRALPAYRDGFLMPEPRGAAEIVAYETTTEGTPASPAFPNTPEGRLALVNWCAEHATTFADHRADAETWAAVLFGDGLAAVGTDGRVTFA